MSLRHDYEEETLGSETYGFGVLAFLVGLAVGFLVGGGVFVAGAIVGKNDG